MHYKDNNIDEILKQKAYKIFQIDRIKQSAKDECNLMSNGSFDKVQELHDLIDKRFLGFLENINEVVRDLFPYTVSPEHWKPYAVSAYKELCDSVIMNIENNLIITDSVYMKIENNLTKHWGKNILLDTRKNDAVSVFKHQIKDRIKEKYPFIFYDSKNYVRMQENFLEAIVAEIFKMNISINTTNTPTELAKKIFLLTYYFSPEEVTANKVFGKTLSRTVKKFIPSKIKYSSDIITDDFRVMYNSSFPLPFEDQEDMITQIANKINNLKLLEYTLDRVKLYQAFRTEKSKYELKPGKEIKQNIID